MSSRRAPLLLLGLGTLLLAATLGHAFVRSRARHRDQAAIDMLVGRLPAPDLSFAGSSRHLRFPSLEEPGAAFTDAPASPDLDPAGAAVAPPRDVYVLIAAARQRGSAAPVDGQARPR